MDLPIYDTEFEYSRTEPARPFRVAEPLRHAMRERKLQRIAKGGSVRCLDLFAGCGGLTLGFQAAGLQPWAAVEFDALAAASHGLNFFGTNDTEHARARDVSVSPFTFAKDFGLSDPSTAVDVLVGGPPCQAFARVGRAKLREVADHPEAFKLDHRARLYLDFLAYIEAFQPLAVVMENVPDVLNFGGMNIPEEVCDVLESRGYNCRYTLLNSSHYGVPQMRERMFLVALANELGQPVTLPAPTHQHTLPSGYEGTRAVALKMLGDDLFKGNVSRFQRPPEACADLPAAVTAREALADLPPITLHLEGKLRRGARRFDELIHYTGAPLTAYGRLMREWAGFESREGVSDHVIRSLPRDYKIFARMQPGDQYPQAYELAQLMLEEEVDRRVGANASESRKRTLREQLRAEFVPPYDAGKFPNKWRKMEPDAPARTLMAHLGKDGYSHIHYDSAQARTISVREAARLQSFPDGFKFCGTMNPAFRQIGNAVPPLLAKAVAGEVMSAIRKAIR
jgi:DNA (cytosine-5)-methyltransferase 1